MENPKLDETLPTQINPEEAESSNLNETQASPTGKGQPTSQDFDQTVPTPISRESRDHSGFDETIPPPSDQGASGNHDAGDESPGDPNSTAITPKKPTWRIWTVIGILALILIAFTSAFLGYNSGISKRKEAETTQVAILADEQYRLGLQDMEAHRYERARQRFEYVIQLDPNYVGATENLANALLYQSVTATPTIAPTPTVSPTPDLRGVEELSAQAQQELANSEWGAAIDTLLSLRKMDPDYQAVWVDDMLYVSFRNRGAEKILKEGDLEGGIYDLTLAEQFGPLDVDAKGYLTWASLYITGASFWELDWGQAVYYFAQVAPALPNLRDGSGWTATERYRLAVIGYAGFLADLKEWCDAQEQYELALTLAPDPNVEHTLDFVKEKCSPKSDEKSQPTPEEPGSESSPTPIPDGAPTATESPPTESPPTESPPTESPPTDSPPTEPPPTQEPSSTPEA